MGFWRKVIRVTAMDSPNVRLGEAQARAGLPITHEELIPGVLSYAEYLMRRATWDEVRQSVGLDARFYRGARLLLFPPERLNEAEQYDQLLLGRPRRARGIGVDPAEGGDSSCWCVVDEWGILEIISVKTPNTSDIPDITLDAMRRWDVTPERVVFDRGGGGRHAADYLRKHHDMEVRTVAFGATPVLEPRRGLVMIEERKELMEERYEYVNLRAQLYVEASRLLDPSAEHPFGISGKHRELRRQLAPMPKLYDKEGRYRMLSKNRPTSIEAAKDKSRREKTLVELLGCSPDEADSFVLAVHAMQHEGHVFVAGAI